LRYRERNFPFAPFSPTIPLGILFWLRPLPSARRTFALTITTPTPLVPLWFRPGRRRRAGRHYCIWTTQPHYSLRPDLVLPGKHTRCSGSPFSHMQPGNPLLRLPPFPFCFPRSAPRCHTFVAFYFTTQRISTFCTCRLAPGFGCDRRVSTPAPTGYISQPRGEGPYPHAHTW